MADFLAGMTIASRRRARSRARRIPPPEMRRRAAEAPPPPPLALSAEGFDLIAEVKRRAPGDGRSAPARDPALPARLAAAYAAGGAAAVSVLTEPLAFDGGLDDLAAASRALRDSPRPVPTLGKDFLVDPYQVFEARAAGAGGVLLIAGTAEAEALLDAAAEAGLWLLIEAFEDALVPRAVELAEEAAARGVEALVGVNVRDLRTLAVDPRRLARVAPRLPAGRPTVAESGIRTPADAAAAARLGYRGALVGRALAAADAPGALVSRMIAAGRAARRDAA